MGAASVLGEGRNRSGQHVLLQVCLFQFISFNTTEWKLIELSVNRSIKTILMIDDCVISGI